ncbi:MAG: 2-C-methyl-D-erythritol 4-phosphate cytidylyltransferase [Clostridiales bacterium]|nr:2-C-methyl-D-erythritol 4-phosphate cytidylyltransferase [Clostridiales bacterium]
MIFGAILAGGIGSRMGNVEKPKQFLHIGRKPILIHTVEKFIINDKLDKVIVLCPDQWLAYTKDLLEKYIPGNDVAVIKGGSRRNETILNAISYIEENFGLDEETILVTHDAVRPFVTHRIIEENIEMAQQGAACNTVIPATDTIVESRDGKTVSLIPDRSMYYQGQTPQTFRAKRFRDLYLSLSEEEKAILTDAAKVFVVKGDEVRIVLGETFNIKVTYPYDLQLAETLLGGNK